MRETEALVRRLAQPPGTPRGTAASCRRQAWTRTSARLEQDLAEKLGAQVAIQHGAGGRGRLVVSYNSLDELDGILGHRHWPVTTRVIDRTLLQLSLVLLLPCIQATL